jgi:LDH2 family malate/lactate/ureidoglycolate dehydrogenase
MKIPASQVRAQIASILSAWGMAPYDVEVSADVMVQTDLAGVDSHGVAMLTMYDDLRELGHLNFQAKPRIVREAPAVASIDGDNGLGHPVGVRAMGLAIQKAQACGIGAVTVFNSAHFGATGYYSGLAAKEGMIGLALTTTRLMGVVPTLSAQPALGTNPIAFAAPAKRHLPFSLDMSTSTTAVNKIRVMAYEGKPLPAGWVLDAEGKSITDAQAAMDYMAKSGQGGMTPIGGTPEMASHKGYGLAMMVQILAGTLAGGSFSPLRNQTQGKRDPDNIGHFFLAIDPKAFRGEGEFENELDDALEFLHRLQPIDPAHPVLVPGEPEVKVSEERRRDGIPIPARLAAQLEAICERCGVPYLFGGASAAQ